MKLLKLLSFGLLLFVFACSEDDPVVREVVEIDLLESSNQVFPRSVEEIEGLIDLSGSAELQALKSYLQYDINIYEITYTTNYNGQDITASGLVTFPETDEAVPMMSFQHGTMIAHADAPTKDKGTYTFLSSVASAGYIFLIPDFIGFGSSSDVLHPYYDKDLTASSVIDMMKAARELAYQEGYNFDGRVFLSGYSEGGYATMATHKEMEENPFDGLELIASAPSSGGYDVKGMQEYFFSKETYHQPFYMAYVALAYKTTYDWTEPLSTFFNEPYATNIPSYFDGTKDGGQINGLLTEVIADYVNADFLNNVDTDPKFTDIVNAFEDNSLDEWVPTTRMMMYHGTADVTVPYQNSVDTYNRMIELGANTSIVSFTDLPGATHGSGFFPYLFDIMDQFETLK